MWKRIEKGSLYSCTHTHTHTQTNTWNQTFMLLYNFVLLLTRKDLSSSQFPRCHRNTKKVLATDRVILTWSPLHVPLHSTLCLTLLTSALWASQLSFLPLSVSLCCLVVWLSPLWGGLLLLALLLSIQLLPSFHLSFCILSSLFTSILCPLSPSLFIPPISVIQTATRWTYHNGL
jgi:hypothetical protein